MTDFVDISSIAERWSEKKGRRQASFFRGILRLNRYSILALLRNSAT